MRVCAGVCVYTQVGCACVCVCARTCTWGVCVSRQCVCVHVHVCAQGSGWVGRRSGQPGHLLSLKTVATEAKQYFAFLGKMHLCINKLCKAVPSQVQLPGKPWSFWLPGKGSKLGSYFSPRHLLEAPGPQAVYGPWCCPCPGASHGVPFPTAGGGAGAAPR